MVDILIDFEQLILAVEQSVGRLDELRLDSCLAGNCSFSRCDGFRGELLQVPDCQDDLLLADLAPARRR